MTETIKNEISSRKNIFWFLVVAIGVFVALYVLLLGHTIYTVSERQIMERQIAKLDNASEQLEADYLALKSQITKEVAVAKGFTEISSSVKYISRTPASKSLTLNTEI